MPVPTAPPPGARRPAPEPDLVAPPPKAGAPVNDLLPFLDFVERHPVGSSVNGVVESYSSHGAYVGIGDLRGYVPLRLMGDPPPRSAREAMKIGDAVTLVVTSFAPARRSVDLAVPHVAPVAEVQPTPELEELAEAVAPARRASKRTAKKTAKEPAAPRKARAKKVAEPAVVAEPEEPAPAKRAARKTPAKAAPKKTAPAKRTSKKAVTEPPSPDGDEATPTPAKRAPRKRAAKAAAT